MDGEIPGALTTFRSCVRTAGFIVTDFLGISFFSLKCMLEQRSILYFLWVPFEI